MQSEDLFKNLKKKESHFLAANYIFTTMIPECEEAGLIWTDTETVNRADDDHYHAVYLQLLITFKRQ